MGLIVGHVPRAVEGGGPGGKRVRGGGLVRRQQHRVGAEGAGVLVGQRQAQLHRQARAQRLRGPAPHRHSLADMPTPTPVCVGNCTATTGWAKFPCASCPGLPMHHTGESGVVAPTQCGLSRCWYGWLMPGKGPLPAEASLPAQPLLCTAAPLLLQGTAWTSHRAVGAPSAPMVTVPPWKPAGMSLLATCLVPEIPVPQTLI